MAASTVGRIDTHLRNAVPLVWGSLRLAPIIWTFYLVYIVCAYAEQYVMVSKYAIALDSGIEHELCSFTFTSVIWSHNSIITRSHTKLMLHMEWFENNFYTTKWHISIGPMVSSFVAGTFLHGTTVYAMPPQTVGKIYFKWLRTIVD